MSENENEVVSRHGELKYRLRQRLTQEIFDCMPEKVQDYFIQSDPADLKEAYISTMLRLPWTAGNAIPDGRQRPAVHGQVPLRQRHRGEGRTDHRDRQGRQDRPALHHQRQGDLRLRGHGLRHPGHRGAEVRHPRGDGGGLPRPHRRPTLQHHLRGRGQPPLRGLLPPCGRGGCGLHRPPL